MNTQNKIAVVAEIENSGQRALALQLNVSDHSNYAGFFSNELSPRLQETFSTSKFDFLINNAGTGQMIPFDSTTISQLDEMNTIHLKAGYFFTQHALEY
jgi:NAD(P)-dependent dehydrogenase (short-subunit alcohol dehydrogenase family)